MPKIREKSTKVDDEFSSDTEEISDEEKGQLVITL